MSAAIYAIVIAAVVGSVAGSLFETRVMALICSTPIVVLIQGVLLLIAPSVEARADAPDWMRAAAGELDDPALLLQSLIACAIGALVASSMLRHVRRNRIGRVWLPGMDPAPAGRPPAKGPRASRLEQRVEAAGAFRQRRPTESPAELPVYEIAPSPPPAPSFRPAGVQPPAPSPAAPPDPGRRRKPRRRSALAGHLLGDDGTSAHCTIQNLSQDGARVRLAAPMLFPERLCLLNLSNGLAHDAEIAWRDGPAMGLRFRRSYDLNHPQDPRGRELQRYRAALMAR